MRYSIRIQNVTLTPADEEQMNKKMRSLKKHVVPPYVTAVSLEKSTHHGKGDTITCKINIEQGKHVYHAERTGDTIQTALDQTIEAIRGELKKFHDKQKRHGGGVQK